MHNILKELISKYKKFIERIIDFNTSFLLYVFYFVIILPLGFMINISYDTLQLKKKEHTTYWEEREIKSEKLEDTEKQ